MHRLQLLGGAQAPRIQRHQIGENRVAGCRPGTRSTTCRTTPANDDHAPSSSMPLPTVRSLASANGRLITRGTWSQPAASAGREPTGDHGRHQHATDRVAPRRSRRSRRRRRPSSAASRPGSEDRLFGSRRLVATWMPETWNAKSMTACGDCSRASSATTSTVLPVERAEASLVGLEPVSETSTVSRRPAPGCPVDPRATAWQERYPARSTPPAEAAGCRRRRTARRPGRGSAGPASRSPTR